jgi:NMT1/THI5 like protein
MFAVPGTQEHAVSKLPFIIEPHFRLQEWVAEEKGYFQDEGLDYVFQELIQSTDGKHHDRGDKVGAFQSFERGREAAVSCACHWTVGVAASQGKGRLYADVYSIAPSGVFVAADSPIRRPEDLAGVPISVGYQSGSHYSTIQALEQYLPADRINLSFAEGMLFARLDNLLSGASPASALFNGPYYLAEQLGYRKIVDTTFMIATMITGDPDTDDLRRFFAALRRAQRDIDLRPDRYVRYYRNEFPVRYHATMDTRRWGPGERLVFETYTQEAFDASRKWIASHEIFPNGDLGSKLYDQIAVG